MDIELALEALSALAHETRLWAFRLLVQAGNMDAFKDSMTHSAEALGSSYLADMLEKSKLIQGHLL